MTNNKPRWAWNSCHNSALETGTVHSDPVLVLNFDPTMPYCQYAVTRYNCTMLTNYHNLILQKN